MFLKAQVAGHVKTRLAASIGARSAAEVYRFLAERQIADLPPCRPLEIHFTPTGAGREMMAWLGSAPKYVPNVKGISGHGWRMPSGGPMRWTERRSSASAPTVPRWVRAISRTPVRDWSPASRWFLVRRPTAVTISSGSTAPVPRCSNPCRGARRRRFGYLWSARNVGFDPVILDPKSDIDTIGDLDRAIADGLVPKTLAHGARATLEPWDEFHRYSRNHNKTIVSCT